MLCTSLCCSHFSYEQSLAFGNIYYVDPNNGNDAKTGNISNPWKTVGKSISKMQPGDTLYLRGGTYLESNITLSRSGTEAEPITIKNYPGETPLLEDAGDFLEFRSIPNSEWQVVDAKRKIFVSSRSFSIANIQGYFQEGNNKYRLVPYARYGDFSSDNENFSKSRYIYVGPGVYYDKRSDSPTKKKIFIRLQHSDIQEQRRYLYPSNTDPRQTVIYLYPSREFIQISRGVSHIHMEGLAIRSGLNALLINSYAHHIIVKNCNILGGRTHIRVIGETHHLTLDGITIIDYFPPWICYSDVKVETSPPGDSTTYVAGSLKLSPLILGENNHDIEIKNSTFMNLFDGIVTNRILYNFHVHNNTFDNIVDDIMQINSGGYHFEIDHNRFLNVTRSVSRQEQGQTPLDPGTKYIHHNIIDARRKFFHSRPGSFIWKKTGDGMLAGPPFGRHGIRGIGQGDPWKIYNNTILMADARNGNWVRLGAGYEYAYSTFFPGNPHEVYNNIFVQTANHMVARSVRVADGSQILDGNLYYFSSTPLTNPIFENFSDGLSIRNFNSLAVFKKSSFFTSSKSIYAKGFENSGIQANPQLDINYYPDPDGPAAEGAVTLPKGWPGQDGGRYRGALPPKYLHRK